MKKNYLKLIALSLGLAFSFTMIAQADADTKTFTADEIEEILSSSKKNMVKYPSNKTHCEDTITTPLLSGNGSSGVMFDLVVGGADITLETFWVSTDNTDSVVVYYRTGTFVGNNTSQAGWIYLGGNTVVGQGDGIAVKIDANFSLPLTNGTTYAFYVTTLSGGMNYTNGTTVGNTLVSNADLSVLEGNGGGFFSVTFSPRNFNGRVQYCLTTTGINDILSGENVAVYPNPVSNELNISLPSNGKTTEVSIYNVIGEIVFTESIIANGSASRFDISNLDAGVYIVKLATDESEYSTKIFVE